MTVIVNVTDGTEEPREWLERDDFVTQEEALTLMYSMGRFGGGITESEVEEVHRIRPDSRGKRKMA